MTDDLESDNKLLGGVNSRFQSCSEYGINSLLTFSFKNPPSLLHSFFGQNLDKICVKQRPTIDERPKNSNQEEKDEFKILFSSFKKRKKSRTHTFETIE